MLAYLEEEARARFAGTLAGLPVHWLANEGQGVVAGVMDQAGEPPRSSTDFVLALDGAPIAFTQPHGRSLHWLA